MESAKLLKATGEPLRALQELETSMRLSGMAENQEVVDLTQDDSEEFKLMRAKVSPSTYLYLMSSINALAGTYFISTVDERLRTI